MKKIEKEDWFCAGMEILATEGFRQITVERLCLALKVTKGSFYHHFLHAGAYVEALMQYWVRENTEAVIEQSEKASEAAAKWNTLSHLVRSRTHKSEQVIRGWSFSDDTVKRYVAQADRLRLDYTTRLLEQSGLDASTARHTALLEYACLIGIQQLYPDLSPEKMEELDDLLHVKNKI